MTTSTWCCCSRTASTGNQGGLRGSRKLGASRRTAEGALGSYSRKVGQGVSQRRARTLSSQAPGGREWQGLPRQVTSLVLVRTFRLMGLKLHSWEELQPHLDWL